MKRRTAMMSMASLATSAFSISQMKNSVHAGGIEVHLPQQPNVKTLNSACATVHPLATQAAMNMIDQGGNAIDGAIAAALVLGVVDGHNSGIGGGCLCLIRTANGEVLAVDGRETAPAASTETMFVRNGKVLGDASQTGPLAVAVPSQIAALARIHKLGKLKWADLFAPAIHAADNGYVIGRATANTIREQADKLRRFIGSSEVLLDAQTRPFEVGMTLRQPDLANTLRMIASHGPDWFYRDGFAKQCCDYIQSIGGILTTDDFANYRAVDRKVIETRYRGHHILGFPPPSSGGTHIAQMLNMLEAFPVAEIASNSRARYFHLLAECMKIAFADRAYWLGDSDFVDVPAGLVDRDYAKELAKQISLDKIARAIEHGNPYGADKVSRTVEPPRRDEQKHTTHLTFVDADGNWVAITNTVNTSWGSKVMVPKTGVMLNNQMDDFSISPGTPNAFGLVGSAANSIAPRKRPLSSMSPTIVLDSDRNPWLTCGAAGGPRIINATLQSIVGCIDLKQSIATAIRSPRIHHQWRPDTLNYEPAISPAIVDELKSLGHSMKPVASIAVAQGIERRNNRLIAVADPRAEGLALD